MRMENWVRLKEKKKMKGRNERERMMMKEIRQIRRFTSGKGNEQEE